MRQAHFPAPRLPPIWRSFGVYVKNAVYTTLGNTMPLALSLILGAGYYIALAAIGIYTATLRLWLPYIAGSITFLVALTIGGNWAASGEDGPSGFAVVAAHGLIFWVAAIAHIIRWLRTLLLSLKRFIAKKRQQSSQPRL